MSSSSRGADPPRPVLYLDIDDTLLMWEDEKPHAAPGAAAFLSWALGRFEVRWLTRWCPDGAMPGHLLEDLCKMLDLETGLLRPIRGSRWREEASKLEGIVWLDHVVLGRPFLWLEDEYGLGEFEREFLARHGFGDSWIHCNVSADPEALRRVHRRLAAGHDPGPRPTAAAED